MDKQKYREKGVSFLVPYFSLYLILILSTSITAQIDPHYKNLFQKGEQSFFEEDYKTAAKRLELAVFGLRSDKNLTAKCYTYLSLCHHYLDDEGKSNQYFQQARSFLDETGFLGLELDQSVLDKLESVFYVTYPRENLAEESETEVNSSQEQLSEADLQLVIKSYEEQIQNNPQRIPAYYGLYRIYLKQNDLEKAAKTLEKLVNFNPKDINALFLVGRLEYERRKYSNAAKHLENFFNQTDGISIEEDRKNEAAALYLLSLHFKGDRNKALQIASSYTEILTETTIQTLSLHDKDKPILIDIMTKAIR